MTEIWIINGERDERRSSPWPSTLDLRLVVSPSFVSDCFEVLGCYFSEGSMRQLDVVGWS